MSLPVLYKPVGSPNSSSPGNAGVLLPAGNYTVQVVDPKGNVIDNLSKVTIPHVPEPGQTQGEFGSHYTSKRPGTSYPPGSVLKVTNGGTSSYVSLKDPSVSITGHVDSGEGESFDSPAELPVNPHGEPGAGGGGAGTSGVPGQFQPGQVGQYGATPAYIGSLFPEIVKAIYKAIPGAAYKFTDPMEFAKTFGEFNRGEITKNFNQSSDLALKELDTELKGLEHFVPAADALKKSQISSDNAFNIAERTKATDQTLPGVRSALEQQGKDAAVYARGDVPDAVLSRALDISTGSTAADIASSGGFGAKSSAERRITDLMSADKRIQLSQYGNNLLGQNASERASLFTPPTEYDSSGNEIRVNPSQSVSQLIGQQENAINGLATIPAGQALSSTTQQEQFKTGVDQDTQKFNASNELQLSEFNTTNANNFALTKFGYQAQYANTVAGAAQNNINTNFGVQQQQQYMDFMNQYLQSAQNAAQNQSLFSGLFGGLTSMFGKGGLFNKGGPSASGAGAAGEVSKAGTAGNVGGGLFSKGSSNSGGDKGGGGLSSLPGLGGGK